MKHIKTNKLKIELSECDIERIILKSKLKDEILPKYIRDIILILKRNLEMLTYGSHNTINKLLNEISDYIKQKYSPVHVEFALSINNDIFNKIILLTTTEEIKTQPGEHKYVQYNTTFTI